MARVRIAALLPLVVAIGLAARFLLTGAVANFSGVALWSVLVYLLVVLAKPDVRPPVATAITAAISLAVELFQLTGVPLALADVSVLFRLALGTHFDASDLPAYAAGSLAAGLAHAAIQRKAQPSPR